MSANGKYFPALDGLRAFAFLLVFLQHYFQMPWGWSGVDIFFVLSGFLITGILYDTCQNEHRVRNFYIRRTLRIFPLYYGLMLLLLASYIIFRWNWTAAWLVWPAYLGNFTHGLHPFEGNRPWQDLVYFQPVSRTIPGFRLYLGHFWSLCVEEQFYLVWPWIVFALRDRRKLMKVCWVFLILCPVMRLIGNHTLPRFMLDQQVLYEWTPFRIDALLLGGLIALIRRGPSSQHLLKVARIAFRFLFAVLIAYLAYGATHRSQGLAHPTWALTWGLVYLDAFAACLIVMAIERGSITYTIFNLRPLRWLGTISYGAYVFHDIFHLEIVAVVSRFTHDTIYTPAAIAFLLTIFMAWISYQTYESFFIRLKDRWTREDRQVAVAN